MDVHIVEVTIQPDGTVLVNPAELKAHPGDLVTWVEIFGSPTLLTFEDPSAFPPGRFPLSVDAGVALIAKVKGTFPYTVTLQSGGDAPVSSDPPSVPVIIVSDPSQPAPVGS